MLAIDERVVDNCPGTRRHDSFISEALDLGKVHILACCLHGSQTNITTDYLDVQVRLDLTQVLNFASELLKLISAVNGPVLEWICWSELTNGLLKRIHQSLYKETSCAAERVPEVELASFLSTVKDATLKDAGRGQSLVQHAPSHIWSISVLIETII